MASGHLLTGLSGARDLGVSWEMQISVARGTYQLYNPMKKEDGLLVMSKDHGINHDCFLH